MIVKVFSLQCDEGPITRGESEKVLYYRMRITLSMHLSIHLHGEIKGTFLE